MLSKFNLTIPSDRILKIETGIANKFSKNIDNNIGVFVPPDIIYNAPLHFAIDNVDFSNDTPDGKNKFHGVGQVVFQKSNGKKETEKSKFTTEARNEIRFNKNILNNIETFQEPSPPNDIFDFDGQILYDKMTMHKTYDKVWTITSVINKSMPTWNAYNFLISKEKEPTIIQFLPLYPGPLTDWSNLYSVLKWVQGIATSTIPNLKAVVTLDLQLYDKCMQMTDDSVIRDNFIFPLGELHIVFARLKVLGKYIIDSGLDDIFIGTGIYSPTTFGQIIEGKHTKRCLEAYFMLCLDLSAILFENVLSFDNEKWTELKTDFLRLTNSFLDLQKSQNDEYFKIHNLLI